MAVKAYSYMRFSSAAQAEGDSLRRQLKAAHDWAARHPEVELDTTTRDLGVSAFKGEHRVRGALSSFLERVREGKIERGSYFLVESFDRLSRENETVAINLLTGITLAGVRVVTLVDGHVYDDKSDAMDLLRAIIVMSRAHEENKARGLKLAAAWADKKQRARVTGEILTRRGPAWTEFNESKKSFDLVPERATVIRRIFAECLDGLGAGVIASRLNDDGVSTFVGHSKGWHTGYVMTILKSRSVMGFYQPTLWSKTAGERAVRDHDGEDIPNYYPVVIERDVFNRAQAVLNARSRPRTKGRRGKNFPNILLGLGRCEECGGSLVLGNSQNKARVRFWRCYDSTRKHNCSNKTRYSVVDVEKTLADFITLAKVDSFEVSTSNRELTVLRDRQTVLKRKIEALLDQLEDGVPGVADRLRQRQTELLVVEKSLAEAIHSGAARSNATWGDSLLEAVQWMDAMSKAEGDDLYRARAKANALLNDLFDFVMPVADGGLYVGHGDTFRYVLNDEEGGDLISGHLPLPGLPLTGAALDGVRGPIPGHRISR